MTLTHTNSQTHRHNYDKLECLSWGLPGEEQVEAGRAKQHSAHSVQPQACLGAGAAHAGAAAQTALRLNSQERVRCPGW